MEPATANSLIRMQDICQAYTMGEHSHFALKNVSLDIQRGQTCAILGASGSGKSTLLNILGLLDQPVSGDFHFGLQSMTDATSEARARLRNTEIGFVFQSFNLLPRLTALENVALPLFYRGYPKALAHQQAQMQIERVGLGDRLKHFPADLSGGQRQRMAIARALVGEPSLILADEPTGNLDRTTADDVMDLLLGLNREKAVTLIVVTHDPRLAGRMQRCFLVEEGEISERRQHRDALDA
ncbi:ABC transporter ATP-binding protein [Pseudomonas syringae]|uniref:ABC transporter ATP-binding protein n=1 Tax=Pseudomonas syringae TaxID=317 RepID=UPI003BB4FD14